MELHAYFDDSRSPDPDIFVLFGYVSTPEHWANFTQEWEHALRGLNLRSFKMSEAVQWSAERKREIIPYLYSVINRNVLMGVEIIVDPIALREELDNFTYFPTNTPYYFCFTEVIIGLLQSRYVREHRARVAFTFDEQRAEERIIRGFWDHFMSTMTDDMRERLIDRPVFTRDEDAIPIQAADFRAWTARNYYVGENQEFGERIENRTDLNAIRIMHVEWTRERLIEYRNPTIPVGFGIRLL